MFETLGHYKILDRIGAGGLGEVFRARDTKHGRTVAIKVPGAGITGDPGRRERFVADARAAAALSHPNIATLYEIGEDQGQLFLVFEFVPGEPLNSVVAGRPLNARRAIDFAIQIADALADAHAEAVVHCDLKPANIIITPKDKAKILDFGLSAWTAGGAERERAAHDTGAAAGAAATLGTIAYLSPEQALGEKVDHRTDIFSLGVVLFEMLTGRLPFAGAAPAAVTLQIVQATAPAPSAVNPSLSPEIDVIVGRALAKSLANRYESAATMAAELRSVAAILDVRSEVSEAAGTPIDVSAPRERSGAGWLIALLLIAALGGIAWYERTPLQRLWRSTLGPAPAPVIAIAPFDADPNQTFFADGLAEDLSSRLGQTPGVKVLGRSATRSYRGRAPHDIARDLGAAVVLTGSVRLSADAMQLSLELIDPADDTAIWSGQYPRDVKDAFAVQAQIAEEIAAALRLKVQPTGSSARAASRVVDRRGYELYLRGRQASADRRLPEAISLYEQAIAADAGLAEAFAGVAEALYRQVSVLGAPNDPVTRTRTRTAAARAYELDADLPQANVAMSVAAEPLGDALKYLRRAVELDPSYADAYRLIGDEIADFDHEPATAAYRKSLALDPRLDITRVDLAVALALAGRDDEARKALQAVSRVDSATQVDSMIALIDLYGGRYREAASEFAAIPDVRSAPALWAPLAAAFRLANRTDDALAEAMALQTRFPQDCRARVTLAALQTERGERAAAHRLADGLVALASLEAPLPSDLRCGLHAAAAVVNPAAAAALLDKVRADERLLRGFAAPSRGESGSMWIAERSYPWLLIAGEPAVLAARQRLDAAYAHEREIARTVLAGMQM